MRCANVNRAQEWKRRVREEEDEEKGAGWSAMSASVGTIRESNANAMNRLRQVSGLVGGPKAHSPV